VIDFSTKFFINPHVWLGFVILAAGMIFVGLGIGELLGKSGSIILKQKVLFPIGLGTLSLTAGIVWIIINRNIITPQNVDIPMVLIGYGLMLLIFA